MSDKFSKEWGSSVAKRGFQNEEDIADKFRNWTQDSDAKHWINIMGYSVEDIESITVDNLEQGCKPDLIVHITSSGHTDSKNISIKRATSANYNQVDKRWVSDYAEMWEMPQIVENGFKLFAGRNGWTPEEISDKYKIEIGGLKDKKNRRLYFHELPEEFQTPILEFLEDSQKEILEDIIAGSDPRAGWFLVTSVEDDDSLKWYLRSTDNVLRLLTGEITTTSYGNIKMGKVTLQRKGGDNGRETAQKLQFKISPLDLV